jgi:hypothetical protein
MSNTRTRSALSVGDIEAGYENEEWLGWGYLGGRQELSAVEREHGDVLVLAYANKHGWDIDRLFLWLNSRPGRHFADDVTLGSRHAEALLGADLSD